MCIRLLRVLGSVVPTRTRIPGSAIGRMVRNWSSPSSPYGDETYMVDTYNQFYKQHLQWLAKKPGMEVAIKMMHTQKIVRQARSDYICSSFMGSSIALCRFDMTERQVDLSPYLKASMDHIQLSLFSPSTVAKSKRLIICIDPRLSTCPSISTIHILYIYRTGGFCLCWILTYRCGNFDR